ncbi:hypothetical protein V9R53_003991 [Vibrio mimicus]
MENMAEVKVDLALIDPLSDVTRRERRMLLAVSMLGIFLARAGIVPTKVSALGIELSTSDQKTFLLIIGASLLYFVTAFVLYALSDFIVWKKSILSDQVQQFSTTDFIPDNLPRFEFESRLYQKNKVWYSATKPVSICRAFFEFILPILVGLAALVFVVQLALNFI